MVFPKRSSNKNDDLQPSTSRPADTQETTSHTPSSHDQPASRPKQVNTGISKSRPKTITPDMFKPKALATKTTHLKNDPLLSSSVVVEGLTAVAPSQSHRFELDVSQYFTLVRQLYTYLVRDKNIKTRVSLSMFEYYAEVLLWDRVLYVTGERSGDRSASSHFCRSIPAELAVPEELGRYLDSIGNILDLSDREFFLSLRAGLNHDPIHGLAGHYGPVNAETHVLYETMPAPFVAAYRMCYEYGRYLSKANFPDEELDEEDEYPAEWPTQWDLPAQLSPGVPYSPNRNLLGWNSAQDITSQMAQFFENNVVVDVPDQTLEVINFITSYTIYPFCLKRPSPTRP